MDVKLTEQEFPVMYQNVCALEMKDYIYGRKDSRSYLHNQTVAKKNPEKTA